MVWKIIRRRKLMKIIKCDRCLKDVTDDAYFCIKIKAKQYDMIPPDERFIIFDLPCLCNKCLFDMLDYCNGKEEKNETVSD